MNVAAWCFIASLPLYLVIVASVDLWLYLRYGGWATITTGIRNGSAKHPIIPVVISGGWFLVTGLAIVHFWLMEF